MRELENRMVVDSEWLWQDYGRLDDEVNFKDNFNFNPGYENPLTGEFVPEDDALERAVEHIANGTKDEQQEFIDWFYQLWYKKG